MNLHRMRQLETGDKVKFAIPFPPFTLDKEYEVRTDEYGAWVKSDHGRWYTIDWNITMESHFDPVEKEDD